MARSPRVVSSSHGQLASWQLDIIFRTYTHVNTCGLIQTKSLYDICGFSVDLLFVMRSCFVTLLLLSEQEGF